MFRSEPAEAVAPFHRVRLPGGERLVVGLEISPERVHAVRGQHESFRVGARDHGAIERGVEGDQLVHRHLRERRREPNIDCAGRRNGNEVRLVRDRLEARAESLRIRDDIFQRLELGHVAARFGGHLEAQVIGRQTLRAVSLDRARHAVLTVVVGGEREVPVAVQLVQRLQIVERGIGGGDHVAARVGPPVLAQLESLPGRRNELPQTRGVRARIRHGIERALDHGQQGDLGGHAPLFHLLDYIVQVELAALDHALQILRLARIPALANTDEWALQIGHCETVADAVPQVVRGAGEIDCVKGLEILRFLRLRGRRNRDDRCRRGDKGRDKGWSGGGGDARGRRGLRCRRGNGRRGSRLFVAGRAGIGVPRDLRACGGQHAYCRRCEQLA